MPPWSILAYFAAGALSGCLTATPTEPRTDGVAPSAARASGADHFVWPHATRAAVSLTYDDALESQLDNAVPALARHGLAATFFVTGRSEVLKASPERYRALAQAGHELGAHTMYHPCDRSLGFVKPGFALQDYDLPRMRAELNENLEELRDLGQKPPFSFAYPCGSTWLGTDHASYVPLIEQLFVAARGVNGEVSDPARDTLLDVPSPMGNISGRALTSWVERALSVGGWVVFTFHGVGGDYLPVQADAHEALLAYLEQHETSVWTERFGSVASYVKAQQKR